MEDTINFNSVCSWLTLHSFVSPDIAKKYDLKLPDYPGIDQIVEVDRSGEKL